MYTMLSTKESPSNDNEYIYTRNIPIYISYYFKSLHRSFCTSLLNFFVNIAYTRFVCVPLCTMPCLLYCHVGYEYAMCNVMQNTFCLS